MDKLKIDGLLKRTADGDDKSFEKLYIKTRNGVFAFIYSYLHHVQDSEDVLQEVYIKIRKNISQYKPGTNGKAWILQIAKNESLNFLQKKKRNQTVDLEECNAVYNDRGIQLFHITETLGKVLTEEEYRIVTLFVFFKYKHKEIAQILNKPLGTVTSKYKRAIEKIKNIGEDL